MNGIDLHLHTTYSDGTFSPKQLVRYAYSADLSAVAITDHDITDGIYEAVIEGAKLGIEVVPGIELSVEDGAGTEDEIHILGYYINWENEELQEKLTVFRQVRQKRAYFMLEKLKKLGLALDEEKIFNLSGKGAIGRLHIAKALLDAGYIKDLREAFNKYIGNTGPAYVKKVRLTVEEAIKMVLKVGGVPVLAHPVFGGGTRKKIKSFINHGLLGLEAYYSKHDKNATKLYLDMAEDLNLVVTGGSDCHGSINGSDPLLGLFTADRALLDGLKEAKRRLDKRSKTILQNG